MFQLNAAALVATKFPEYPYSIGLASLRLFAEAGVIGAAPWKTLGDYSRKHPPELFVELQYHNNAVRYRNIWIRSMHLNRNE